MPFPTVVLEDIEDGEFRVQIDNMIFISFDNPIDANAFKNVIDPFLEDAAGIGFCGTMEMNN